MSASSTLSSSQAGPSWGDGFGWRVAVSLTSVFGLTSFLLIYFAFWDSSFNTLQTAVLVVVAILTFIATNGMAWASWGVRYARA